MNNVSVAKCGVVLGEQGAKSERSGQPGETGQERCQGGRESAAEPCMIFKKAACIELLCGET